LYLPYKVLRALNGSYYFLTTSNIKYSIIFYENDDLSAVDGLTVYEFAFAPEVHKDINLPKDNRVSATILKVISDFLKRETNSLLFVCDSTDDKGMARARLFNNWYKKSECEYTEKYDETIEDPVNSDIITSLLIHKDAPNKQLMLQKYRNLSLYYSSFK